uniref:Photosystem II 12 kDa extrinsic protein n=1 Tax=Rhodosorus marinus TaxID=101924 RepID=A0A7S0BF75_9RHOD|mmetsp:Transcript_11054/g.15935  ORF Transcript_11054/g.15935 Transcript_11054/m.15935 type:complete len:148 (+) Transcript_11054:196-639(+)
MAFVGSGSFAVTKSSVPATCARMLAEENSTERRDFLKSVLGAALAMTVPASAMAEVEYSGVPYLGGSDKVDVNNANIRVFQKFPGMYPNIGRLIVKNGPYKDVSEVFQIQELSAAQKEVLKKYENNLIALEPRPEYEIDKINNGLYR